MVSILLKSCSHSLWVTFSVVKKNGALCPAGGNLWAPIKNFVSAACYAVKVNFMMKVYRELNVFLIIRLSYSPRGSMKEWFRCWR